MQQLSSFEQTLAKAHEGLPHLPKGLRDWLVENAWWLVVIGVIAGALAGLSALNALTVGSAWLTAVVGVGVGGALFAGSLINLITIVAVIIFEALAIKPLQHKQKRGWDLLFLAAIVGIVGSLVGSLVSAAVTGAVLGAIVGTVIAAALSFYVLFELRGAYIVSKAEK